MQERGHLAAGDDNAGTVHIVDGGLQPLVTPAVPTDGGARFHGGPHDGGGRLAPQRAQRRMNTQIEVPPGPRDPFDRFSQTVRDQLVGAG